MNETKVLLTVRNIHRNLGIIIAILLLLNQLTIVGIFVTPRGFRMTLAGPITGMRRIESRTGNPIINLIIYGINLVTAKLLIKDEFFLAGSVLTSDGFTLNVGGPLFGLPRVVYRLPDFIMDQDNFHEIVSKQFNMDPNIVNKYRRE